MTKARAAPAFASAPVQSTLARVVGNIAAGKKLVFAMKKVGNPLAHFSSARRSLASLKMRQTKPARRFPPRRGRFRKKKAPLQRGAAAREVDSLGLVILALGDGIGVVDANRPEGRRPDDARANRRPDRGLIVDFDAITLSKIRRDVARNARRACRQPEERRKIRRPIIAEQGSRIGEYCALQADFPGQPVNRELHFGGAAEIGGAAKTRRLQIGRV